VVHNLMLLRRGEEFAYDWAVRFNDHVRDSLVSTSIRQAGRLRGVRRGRSPVGADAGAFLPLLYAAGAAADDKASVAADGVYSGAISMLSVVFGASRQ